MKIRFFLIVATLFLLAACAPKGVTKVTAAQASELIESGDVFVLNTHTPYEGEIDGTDVIIEDWKNMQNHLDELPKDKSVPILVYCQSGGMSAYSANQLVELGYKNVYDLQGGMIAWKNEGFKIVQR